MKLNIFTWTSKHIQSIEEFENNKKRKWKLVIVGSLLVFTLSIPSKLSTMIIHMNEISIIIIVKKLYERWTWWSVVKWVWWLGCSVVPNSRLTRHTQDWRISQNQEVSIELNNSVVNTSSVNNSVVNRRCVIMQSCKISTYRYMRHFLEWPFYYS